MKLTSKTMASGSRKNNTSQMTAGTAIKRPRVFSLVVWRGEPLSSKLNDMAHSLESDGLRMGRNYNSDWRSASGNIHQKLLHCSNQFRTLFIPCSKSHQDKLNLL